MDLKKVDNSVDSKMDKSVYIGEGRSKDKGDAIIIVIASFVLCLQLSMY